MKLIEWILIIPYYLLAQAEQKPDFTGILLIPYFLLAQAEQKPDFTGIYWSLDKRQISCSLIRYWGIGHWTKARLYGEFIDHWANARILAHWSEIGT